MFRPRPRLTYANVVATIALFCALGGGAYAATQLPKNSVGTKQLKKDAVNSNKVKDGSLLGKDFKAGQLPAGKDGAPGPAGPRGETGPRGPSEAYADRTEGEIAIGSGTAVASLIVPAGSYVVTGKANVFNNGIQASADCAITVGATKLDQAELELGASAGINFLPIAVLGSFSATGTTAVQLACTEQDAPGVDIRVSDRSLIATRVEALTQQ